MVDIHPAASPLGKYPQLRTCTSVNNCKILFDPSPDNDEIRSQRELRHGWFTKYLSFNHRILIRHTAFSRTLIIQNICFPFHKMASLGFSNTLNSLGSDYSWCTKKWSLTGGGRLRKKSIKYA